MPVTAPDGSIIAETGIARSADAHRSPADEVVDPFAELDAGQILKTIAGVQRRVDERFPGSGLSRVCRRLHVIGDAAGGRARTISRPILWLRAAVWVGVAVVATSLLATAFLLAKPVGEEKMGFADFVQVLEAGINDVVLIGAALLFLVTIENRIKRRRALAAVHELRALAHIIDMHQLTKDPERVLHPELLLLEPDGKHAGLSGFDLCRYLDYCGDMLSLIGKIAALYVQRFDDAAALAAVNEVETLCTGLTQKIWQKIMIVEAAGGANLPAGLSTPKPPGSIAAANGKPRIETRTAG